MKTYKYLLISAIFIGMLLSGCESLEVTNENDPDYNTTLQSAADVKGLAASLFFNWFMYTLEYDGPGLMLWVGADAGTCSWGNVAMQDFSYEPRITWDNTSSYGNAVTTENYYQGLYGNLSYCNDILDKIIGGMEFEADNGSDETPMVAAYVYLIQGLSLGYIGLLFDQAFIATQYTDLEQTIPLSPYSDFIDSAIVSIDKCIEICESSTFTLPDTWIPGLEMTQEKLGEFANTAAAVLLSYSPRNKTENDAVDWSKVLEYANNGLSYDFSVYNNGSTWYTEYHYYASLSGWGQTDMRVVNMMDSRFPSRWTNADTWNTLPTPISAHTEGIDDRIYTDFGYLSTCGFKVERGYYHFSCYRHKRYDSYITNEYVGDTPVFLKAENDLLKAEAMLHTSDLDGAADVINNGTRVTRGGLDPISATAAEVEEAIFYERNVELYLTGLGVEFFTMRKADMLQEGTPLHLPIPGQQLDVNLMDYYTFGGGVGVAGEDYSDGGWF